MDIREELKETLEAIDEQISAVVDEFPDADAFTLRNGNGDFIMVPILQARATTLLALANLEAAGSR